MMEVKDKVIIVTGASEGIGCATVKILSLNGAKVVLAARSEEKLKKLENEIPGSFAVVTDMRKEEGIKQLVKKTLEKFGRVDILINNAGQGLYGPLESINLNDYRSVMELNVFSAVAAMQEVIPIMRRQGEGMIVNVSSMVAKMYIPGLSAYSSTKYALNALSFIARQELERDNILVCTMSPRMTSTNFGKNAVGDRPSFGNRPAPGIDGAEDVAKKILQLIETGEEDIEMG